MRVVQAGLMDHWMYEVFNEARLHSHQWHGDGNSDKKPIKLSELQGAFYILFIGHSIALFVLLVEKFRKRIVEIFGCGDAGSPRCRRIVRVRKKHREGYNHT